MPSLSVPPAEQVSLHWDKVSCVLNRKGKQRHLLRDVCGSARAGRLLAIMGPSGSGKTTLLNSLAGQLLKSKGLRLEGIVHVNGAPTCGDDALGGARHHQQSLSAKRLCKFVHTYGSSLRCRSVTVLRRLSSSGSWRR